jgi:hypothetical protein
MIVRAILLLLLLSAPSAALASPFSDAAKRLDGEWRGGAFVLRVDARRAQASVDAERPFAWERFLVKEVTPREIVFSIGAELYEAQIEDDVLTLTGTSFTGERKLLREGELLRGTTD